ncbi:hypothetical protein EOA33_12425 [Mesorhizobium sp. M4A.F.Ca.ET.050.02.1.1]|uniref:hypothetical protein n=1 Tax=Mesorhizobium sp. M4A.F.Ca.ET.050.02.1.1 TaxID=2496754 RepID=UPI000FCB576B|nr:hypothetical protein [Mesorhizobium sp. M4A.F.Ca.ET.050.02.1.1]RUX49476.1 hypothetical protein EOA33_12425 [Mesorhizobium sp. M4A.F.Ca.ET.050.02.1.1]TIT95853.1 MAG: hypothetical protein E5W59_00765 [Mesorhizobium sp.]
MTTDLKDIATYELNYIGSNPTPFDLTVISVSKGKAKGFVRLWKTPHQLHIAEFIKVLDPLLGQFTERNALIRALADWAKKGGWTLEMAHVSSETGERLDVNVSAI